VPEEKKRHFLSRTLREAIPQFEADWLLPAWLLIAIATAAIAETITIGLAVQEIYSLPTGWAIGSVVASAQAIGSMMWARSTQHNAGRYVRHKTIGPKGDRKRVEDKANSEPALNVWGPATVSVLAGTISAWVAAALYAADGHLTGLDVALAIASPAGSIAAASLNGVFSYGEAAVSDWRAHQAATKTTGRPQTTTARAQATAVRPPAQARQPSGQTHQTSQALAGHLVTLQARLTGQQQRGDRKNGTFRRADVEEILGISSTHAKNIIRYGIERGVLQKATRYKYRFTN